MAVGRSKNNKSMEANSTEPIKKCSRCGTVLNDKPKFCPNCGSKILWENKKTEYSMAHNVLKVFFSILPFPVIVIFLGVMFSFIYDFYFSNDGIKVIQPKKERTEAEIKRDSITTEIAKEAGITFQEIKSFEKEVNGLTVVSISTGNLPLDIFHTLPACNIKLVNAGNSTISWDLLLNCRAVVDDTHISSSTFCEGTPSYNDPISQGQIVNINCSPGIGSLYIPNKQWEKSKIVIEILKEGKSILRLPIKNETIDMTQFLR